MQDSVTVDPQYIDVDALIAQADQVAARRSRCIRVRVENAITTRAGTSLTRQFSDLDHAREWAWKKRLHFNNTRVKMRYLAGYRMCARFVPSGGSTLVRPRGQWLRLPEPVWSDIDPW